MMDIENKPAITWVEIVSLAKQLDAAPPEELAPIAVKRLLAMVLQFQERLATPLAPANVRPFRSSGTDGS